MDVLLKTKKSMNRDEVTLLMDLIQRNPILISKETNATTNRMKEVTWNSLTSAFNANSVCACRTREQLKLKWENLKKAARSRAKQIRMNNPKTVRGKQDIICRDEILEKVSEILGSTCTGITMPSNDDRLSLRVDLDATTNNMEGFSVDVEMFDTSIKDMKTELKKELCEDSYSAVSAGTSKIKLEEEVCEDSDSAVSTGTSKTKLEEEICEDSDSAMSAGTSKTKLREEICEDSQSAVSARTSKRYFGFKRPQQQKLKRGRKNADVESRVARNYAIARYYDAKKQKIDLEIKLLTLELEEKENKNSK